MAATRPAALDRCIFTTNPPLDWQLSDAVRKMVRFETIDLPKSMRSLGPFNLVVCRNVLIYFDAGTRRSILKESHGTLSRGGWLLLEAAETAFGVEEWFERQSVGRAVIYVARCEEQSCRPT